jgi:hypothetical protein
MFPKSSSCSKRAVSARIYEKQQHPEKRIAMLADPGSMKN